jgi:predicted outer membrane repeat protein
VRVSDIGSASFKNCVFRGNIAEKKGGALVTQVEKKQNRIIIEDTLFCFNEAPEGKHIFNFRDNGHECEGEIGCAFNTKACCTDHGKVIADTTEDRPEGSPSQICLCDAGWSGPACADPAALEGKEEL